MYILLLVFLHNGKPTFVGYSIKMIKMSTAFTRILVQN